MQDEVLNEIAAIAAAFMKLMDPRLHVGPGGYERACAVLAVSHAAVAELSATFELSEERREELSQRMSASSAKILAERQNTVH